MCFPSLLRFSFSSHPVGVRSNCQLRRASHILVVVLCSFFFSASLSLYALPPHKRSRNSLLSPHRWLLPRFSAPPFNLFPARLAASTNAPSPRAVFLRRSAFRCGSLDPSLSLCSPHSFRLPSLFLLTLNKYHKQAAETPHRVHARFASSRPPSNLRLALLRVLGFVARDRHSRR